MTIALSFCVHTLVCGHHDHHIRFKTYFSQLPWAGLFLINDFQICLSLVSSLLTFFSFLTFLITSIHVFLCRPLYKLLPTLKVLHLLDQTLSSILSRWRNHCTLLFCKHCLILFSFSVIKFSALTGIVSLPYSIALLTWERICILFLKANFYWLLNVLNLWTYSIHSWFSLKRS